MKSFMLESGFYRLPLVILFLISCGQKQTQRLNAGDKAPDFSLSNLAGERISLSDFAGKPVLLHFWADWCPHCRAEFPKMQKLNDKYTAANFALLAINVAQELTHVQEIVDEYGLTFPVLLDENSDISKQYGVRGLPTTYVLDQSHRIVRVLIGFTDQEQLEQALLSVINPP